MVARPGLRSLALGELGGEGLSDLLAEGETLFVEHKADIKKGEGFQLAKASASFANTMGGWILVGVKGGVIDPTWTPPTGEFVDAVRQRVEGQIDPLPSFAARILEHPAGKVGVVRVYESADTPHLLRDGSVVVREPAQDAKLRKRGKYEATPIRSHYELLQLAQRGDRARQAAESRFQGGSHPLVDATFGLRFGHGVDARSERCALVLRLAPHTVNPRWREWATAAETVESFSEAVRNLLKGDGATVNIVPHAMGFGVTARDAAMKEWSPGASVSVSRSATAVADGDGVIGLSLGFELHQGSGLVNYHRPIGEGAPLTDLLLPVLEAAVAVLSAGEHFGRFAAHLYLFRMGDLFRVQPDYPDDSPPPLSFPAGGELTVGGHQDDHKKDSELERLCRRWTDEFSRACRIPVWSPATSPD